jgi:hypothetical protein
MLKRIYDILSKYIGDEIVDNVERNYYKSEDRYSYLNLVKGKSYFLMYNDDTFEFPFVFHDYSPCHPGAYGDIGEGYYHKSMEKNCSYGGPSLCNGNYNFKFNKLNDQDKEFYLDILKQHFTFTEINIKDPPSKKFDDDNKCYLILTDKHYSISITKTLEFDDRHWFSGEFLIMPTQIYELSDKN